MVILAVALCTSTLAQRGMLDNHVGVRFGLGTGVTVQHLYTDHRGIEFIALGRYGGLNLTALYEFHQQFFDVRGFKWYIEGEVTSESTPVEPAILKTKPAIQ